MQSGETVLFYFNPIGTVLGITTRTMRMLLGATDHAALTAVQEGYPWQAEPEGCQTHLWLQTRAHRAQ